MRRGQTGAILGSLNPERSRDFGLGIVRGAVVEDVAPGSSAEAAGLRKADSALILRYALTLLVILTAILVSTFAMVYFSGFTLNLMTLGGLALVAAREVPLRLAVADQNELSHVDILASAKGTDH